MKLQLVCLFLWSQFLLAGDIAVVTLAAGDSYRDIVSASLRNKEEYCRKHGYEFICGYESLDDTRPLPWSKIKLIAEVLSTGKYEWVFWTDADSLVMNDAIRLEELVDENYDFILCGDCNVIAYREADDTLPWKSLLHSMPNINTGQFLLKRSAWSLEFLEQCYQKSELVDHPWWEQAAIAEILASDQIGVYRQRTKIIPFRLMNAFPEGHSAGATFAPFTYKRGDFILHFAGTPKDQLQSLLNVYAEQVVHDRNDVSLEEYFKIYGCDQVPAKISGDDGEMVEMIKRHPSIRRMLQIGGNVGCQTVELLANIPEIGIFLMDVRNSFYTRISAEFCKRSFGRRFQSFSVDQGHILLGREEKWDGIYICGLDLYKDCFKRIVDCKSLANAGTILWIDDCHLPWVYDAVMQSLGEAVVEIMNIYYFNDSGKHTKSVVEARYLGL